MPSEELDVKAVESIAKPATSPETESKPRSDYSELMQLRCAMRPGTVNYTDS